MAGIIADRAHELNIETYCFAWAQGALAREHVDHFYDISIFEKEQITSICGKEGINGVVATTELTIEVAAYIAQQLGLNGNPLEVAHRITDKYRNRNAVKQITDLKQPLFLEVHGMEDVDFSVLSFPVIVKPVDAGGKRGVSVAASKEELKMALNYAIQASRGEKPTVIIEEFLEGGREYSVESLSYYGRNYIIQITQKDSSGPPHCVELGHHQPAEISEAMRKKVVRVLDEALTAIGIVNGPCHTEIKIIENEIYLIEFNARPGGDHIAWPLTELSTGYPYITGIIQVALDQFEAPDTEKFQKNYAGVCFVTEQTRQLKAVFDRCQEEDWCYWKNEVSQELTSLSHNDGYNTNFFMYYSKDKKPDYLSLMGKEG